MPNVLPARLTASLALLMILAACGGGGGGDSLMPSNPGANRAPSFTSSATASVVENSSGFTLPVAEYGHGSGPTPGNSVTGGYAYRGPVEALRGHYFFADFVIGNIWAIPLSRLVLGQTVPSSQFTIRSFAPTAGTINNVASFGIDQSNNLYVVDFDGEIFVIEAS